MDDEFRIRYFFHFSHDPLASVESHHALPEFSRQSNHYLTYNDKKKSSKKFVKKIRQIIGQKNSQKKFAKKFRKKKIAKKKFVKKFVKKICQKFVNKFDKLTNIIKK